MPQTPRSVLGVRVVVTRHGEADPWKLEGLGTAAGRPAFFGSTRGGERMTTGDMVGAKWTGGCHEEEVIE